LVRRVPYSALLALALLIPPAASAEPEDTTEPSAEKHLFAGGLMFHFSPLKITGIPGVEPGLAGGIGGGMQFYLGRHLRLGGLGESSSMRFGELRGDYRSVMGALTVIGAIPIGPLDLDLGVAIGGQRLTAYHLREELPGGGYDADRIERTGFILLPSLGIELRLIRRLRILIFAHYYHPHWQDEFYGHTVTIHLGLWFNTYVKPRTPAGGG
jgi:hypothetical protein